MVIDWWKSINEMEIIQTRATQRANSLARSTRCAMRARLAHTTNTAARDQTPRERAARSSKAQITDPGDSDDDVHFGKKGCPLALSSSGFLSHMDGAELDRAMPIA